LPVEKIELPGQSFLNLQMHLAGANRRIRGMRTIDCEENETILIDNEIEITVVEIGEDTVVLRIDGIDEEAVELEEAYPVDL